MGDNEWEEETILVELNGMIDQDWLIKSGHQCKLLGIDTDKPFLQIGRNIFSGEYKDAIGTEVLFQALPGKTDGGTSELEYSCHTSKILSMQRVFLTKKEDTPSSADATACTEQETAESQQNRPTASTSTPMDTTEETNCSVASASNSRFDNVT